MILLQLVFYCCAATAVYALLHSSTNDNTEYLTLNSFGRALQAEGGARGGMGRPTLFYSEDLSVRSGLYRVLVKLTPNPVLGAT